MKALNVTPKPKRPSKSELIDGVEQVPNGIPNEKKGRIEGEGRGGYERKKRKNAVCTGLFTAAADK
jgi:hypothetical protein